MKKLYLVIFVFLVIFLSLIPRITDVLSGNYYFGFDQGRDYLAVKSIVVDKKLTLIGSEVGAGMAGFKGIFHGPFHYYFLAVPFILLNGDPYGGILLTFLYGIGAIILSFYLGKKLFGLYGGLTAAILVAVSPPLISYSRFVWNSHGSVIFILLVFICVYKICSGVKSLNKYLFLAAFFSAFVYNFELAIAIPMSLALLLFVFFVVRVKSLKSYIILFFGFLLGFFPMILFEARHGFTATRGMVEYVFSNRSTSMESYIFSSEVIKDRFGLFVYNFLDTFPRLQYINSNISALFFFVIFVFIFLKEKSLLLKRFFSYLLILPFVHFFVLIFLRSGAYVYYLIDLNFAYIILLTYVLIASYKQKMNLVYFAILLIAFGLFALGLKNAIRTFNYDYKDYGGTAKIKGKENLIDTIYKDANGKKFSLFFFSPPVYTYPYDYLVWWYGLKKYGYLPTQEKKGVFYLAIEPDGSKPWSYKGWLETVIKTGKILETKTLPSGFIIQKRMGI